MSDSERLAFGLGVRGALGRLRDARSAPTHGALPRTSGTGNRGPRIERAPVTGARPAPVTREPRDWAYLGMLAFTAILFFRPQDVFPPLEALHLAEVSAIVGLGAMINSRLRRQERVLPLTPEVIGLLVFAGVMLALVPFSIWPGGSLAMMTGLYLKVVLIFLLMAGTLTTPARLERFVWLIVLASAYLGFRAIADYARGINLVENGRIAGAVGGVFENPNDLALNMVAFLPVALLLAARRVSSPGRLIAALASVLMFVTIVFTKSRGGFLGLGAVLLVLLTQGGKVRRGFGAGLIVAVLLALPLLPASFWDRMASITNDSEDPTGSREARRTVMKEAWRTFLERPLTGVGPGEFVDYDPPWRLERFREAHDVWLQVASEMGVAGAAVFIWLVVAACRNAWRSSAWLARLRRARNAAGRAGAARAAPLSADPSWNTMNLFSAAMMASLAGWIVCATFASVAYNWTFYYVFGITMATRQIATQMATRARPGPRLERTARA